MRTRGKLGAGALAIVGVCAVGAALGARQTAAAAETEQKLHDRR